MTHFRTQPPSGPSITTSVKRFLRDESGAVTVDWVMITAAIVGLAIAVMVQVGSAAELKAEKTETCMRITRNQLLNDNNAHRTQTQKLKRANRACGRL